MTDPAAAVQSSYTPVVHNVSRHQTANLISEARHDRLLHTAGVDAEPIPELEFDQTLGWKSCAVEIAHTAERGLVWIRRWRGAVSGVGCQIRIVGIVHSSLVPRIKSLVRHLHRASDLFNFGNSNEPEDGRCAFLSSDLLSAGHFIGCGRFVAMALDPQSLFWLEKYCFTRFWANQSTFVVTKRGVGQACTHHHGGIGGSVAIRCFFSQHCKGFLRICMMQPRLTELMRGSSSGM